MARPAVRSVAVPGPEPGLEPGVRPGGPADYADAYAVDLPDGVGARQLAETLFTSAPAWVGVLMLLRNLVVWPLGLVATRSGVARAAASLGAGGRIGFFPVLASSPTDVLLGLDDRHLDFRISVQVRGAGPERLGVVVSRVWFRGLLGRAYFVPVRPAHRLIVPAMLRHALGRLRPAGR